MYTDFEMTLLDAEFSGTHTLDNLDTVNYLYGLSTFSSTYNPVDRGQFILLSAENGQSWIVTDENGTIIPGDCETIECAEALIDDLHGGPDPEEANPVGLGYPTEGPFTRFRMRAYVFMTGFFCVFGPIWFFSWKRPSAYYLMVGALIIITGLGLMMGATTI